MNLVNSIFDMRETGKRISSCRKQKNLTQLEIADKLNISYQAVSSWERGETMPDISKLPELAQVLEVSIDYILNNSGQAQIIEMVSSGKISEVTKKENISINDIINTAPLLKPSQLNELLENEFELDSIGELCGIAPFVSMEVLGKLTEKVNEVNSIGELCGIAAFVSMEILDKLAEKVNEVNSIGELCGIAPFVSMEILDKLAEKVNEVNSKEELNGISPFISKEIYNKLAEKTE
jgi:transcriptional regulator with XRE-family HTH domain